MAHVCSSNIIDAQREWQMFCHMPAAPVRSAAIRRLLVALVRATPPAARVRGRLARP
jgi:hypothetical protein